jgi:carboxyl-terminal processing protease
MRLLAALIALFLSSIVLASESPSLDEAIEFSRSRSLNAANVDWEALERDAKGLVASQGEDAAIRFVVKALGDNHSLVIPPLLSDLRSGAMRLGPVSASV